MCGWLYSNGAVLRCDKKERRKKKSLLWKAAKLTLTLTERGREKQEKQNFLPKSF